MPENHTFRIEELKSYFEEHGSDLVISVGFLLYMLGLLNLTLLGSLIFTLFSYLGTIFLVSGVLTKTEVLGKRMNLKNSVIAILIFTSCLLLTTALVVLFIDVKTTYTFSPLRAITAGPGPTYGSDYHDLTGPEALPGLGGLNIELIRPLAWMFKPLFTAGIIVLIIALITTKLFI